MANGNDEEPTLRDLFALFALLRQPPDRVYTDAAREAFKQADAMMAERKKAPNGH